VGDGDGVYRFAIAIDDIASGRSRRCVIDGHSVLVCNIGGEVYAIADTCSHDRGPLGEGKLRGQFIECPRHGSRFDVRDGEPTTPPALRPIATYPARVRDGSVEVLLSG
jgi:nitrite reductase/ring-hydroxylating ferredoxin subunit